MLTTIKIILWMTLRLFYLRTLEFLKINPPFLKNSKKHQHILQKNDILGSNERSKRHNLNIIKQDLSRNKKDLGYKSKSKNNKHFYHCISYDYETKFISKKVKVTRKIIPKINLNEFIIIKTSKKSKIVIKKVFKKLFLINI